jgi:phage terminase large subunit
MNELAINRYADIIADSAEPKSIEDVYRGGFKNIYPALKGADSIRNSIDTLQQYTINITKSSTNLIKEFRTWRWAVDKEGKQLGTPIDKDNHAIDALRYIALNKINKSSKIDLL